MASAHAVRSDENPLIRKLSSFVDFDHVDIAELRALAEPAKWYRQGTTLIHDGDRPEYVFILMEGWACREKAVASGARQIVAYLIPGDLCDPHVFILAKMDHSISLLSDARVVSVPKQAIIEVTSRRPKIAQALWWSTLVDEAVLRHWLVNIGQRDAFDSVAHLFCELWERMNQVGLTRGGSFSLPLTQEQLADTMGMTSVHVNRVLQRMRSADLITMENKTLTIHDIDKLRALGDFDADYLHLDRRQ